MGAKIIGVYSYTHSITNYFVLFAVLGLNNYGNRTIALVRDDKAKVSQTFWSIYSLQLLTSIISLIVYFVYLSFFVSSNKEIAKIWMLFVFSTAFNLAGTPHL